MESGSANVVNLWRDQQLGFSGLRDQRSLIDHRIRTLRDSQKHQVLPWKNRPVGASALSFDNAEQRFLLCGSCVGDVSIVDFESPAEQDQVYPIKHTVHRSPRSQRHRYMISGCQFYPVDSGMFVTSSMDQEVRLWDSESMHVVDKYKNESAILDCHWGMPNSTGIIAVALGSSCVRLIDPRTRNHIQHLRWKGKFAKCLRWMNAPSHLLLAGSESGNMVLWDIRSGRSELMEVSEKHSAPMSSNERRVEAGKAHRCCISSIRCSKDGRYVVSMANDRKVHVWSSYSMQLEHKTSVGESGQCTAMAEIGDEGRELYGFVGVDTDLIIIRLTPKSSRKRKMKNPTSPTKRILRSNAEPATPSMDQRIIRAHFQVVMAVAYRRIHQQVVSSSGDGTSLVWSPEMDEVLPENKSKEIEALYRDDFSDED